MAVPAFSLPNYHLVDLGTLGGNHSEAMDINNRNEVVGRSDIINNGPMVAFLYSNGVISNINPFGGSQSVAHGINDLGQVVGWGYSGTGTTPMAFLRSTGGTTDLGTLGGQGAWANAINESGVIAGTSNTWFTYTPHASRYANGMMEDLGTLDGGISYGNGISEFGEVVGSSHVNEQHNSEGFIFTANGMEAVPGLGGEAMSCQAINSSGIVVGTSNVVGDMNYHSFRWDGSATVDLGAVPGGTDSVAQDINSHGDIVGWTKVPFPALYAGYLYHRSGSIYNLNGLKDSQAAGYYIQDAGAIADSGAIACSAIVQQTGQYHAVILEPTDLLGTVTLNDWTASPNGIQVTFEARDRNTGALVESRTLGLDSQGRYWLSFPGILAGSYDVVAKADHWLAKRAPNVFWSGDATVTRAFSLTNGDVDGDNEVGPGDFAELSSAFGSMFGDANWSANADLDGDGEVGPSDFAVLSTNFGVVGD